MATRTRRSVDDRIAELQARIEKLKASKSKRTRAQDTRRKVLAGAVVFRFLESGDPDSAQQLKALLRPTLEKLLTKESDKELVSDLF